MIKKNYLNIILYLLIGMSVEFMIAQDSGNYNQEIVGLPWSVDMVFIEGGSFMMGAEKNDTTRDDDEKPIHEVLVDDFWMGKYEITWEQYDAFVYGRFGAEQFKSKSKLKNLGIDAVTGATAPYVDMSDGMGKGAHPAINMTQYAAIMYCKWLTAKTGVFYRLPTEAEWEYVCKKGATDKKTNLKDYAWYDDNSQGKYKKTGTKKPNNLGIYDMLGNVSEWVLDQYSSDFYKKSPKKNPWNIPSELYPRVIRGGSWIDTANKLCCTSRQGSKPNWKIQDPQIPKSNWWFTDAPFVGFRVVRPKTQPSKDQIEKYWLEAITDYGMN
jgi:formylglycine-generating enzyme required for sulfatase activity